MHTIEDQQPNTVEEILDHMLSKQLLVNKIGFRPFIEAKTALDHFYYSQALEAAHKALRGQQHTLYTEKEIREALAIQFNQKGKDE